MSEFFVHRARGIESAASALGHVVVIDVLRAFTTAAYAFASGAERIVLVASADESFALRSQIANAVLVGEHEGRKIAGFDHGNSPAEIARTDLCGKTVVLRSSSGTQGVVGATRASAIVLGSLVVASATARWLRAHADEVTLLAMGTPFGGDGLEDDACAEHIEALLAHRTPEPQRTRETVLASDAAKLALDPTVDWISSADLDCALAIDRFDYAMTVERETGLWVARPRRI